MKGKLVTEIEQFGAPQFATGGNFVRSGNAFPSNGTLFTAFPFQ
jgi:hypothetical protein